MGKTGMGSSMWRRGRMFQSGGTTLTFNGTRTGTSRTPLYGSSKSGHQTERLLQLALFTEEGSFRPIRQEPRPRQFLKSELLFHVAYRSLRLV